jgi:hypothetical protein
MGYAFWLLAFATRDRWDAIDRRFEERFWLLLEKWFRQYSAFLPSFKQILASCD